MSNQCLPIRIEGGHSKPSRNRQILPGGQNVVAVGYRDIAAVKLTELTEWAGRLQRDRRGIGRRAVVVDSTRTAKGQTSRVIEVSFKVPIV